MSSRIRQVEHIEGNFSTHVFVDLSPENKRIVDLYAAKWTSMPPFFESTDPDNFGSYHVSLSKHVFLHPHMIQSFLEKLTQAFSAQEEVTLYFRPELTRYLNDNRNTAFAAVPVDLEVSPQCLRLINIVDSVLSQFDLPVYYPDPSPHVSLGCVANEQGFGDHSPIYTLCPLEVPHDELENFRVDVTSVCVTIDTVLSMHRLLRGNTRRWFCNQIQNRPNTPPPAEPQIPHHPMNNLRMKKSHSYVPNFEFTIAQAGMVIASGLAILGLVKMGDIAMEKRKRASQTSVVSEEQVGKPKLGGPWTLYDSKTARPITTEDLRGKFQLIYMGFTYCPDVCPEELQKQAAVVEAVDKALAGTELAGIVQPMFITVDPKRDTLAQVRMYVREFHPRLLGLTGAPEQIKKVTRLFRVYYNEGIRTTNADGEEDYLIDHSIIHYLMGPDNQLVDFYGKNYTTEEMARKIIDQIKKFKNEQDEKKIKRKAKTGVADI